MGRIAGTRRYTELNSNVTVYSGKNMAVISLLHFKTLSLQTLNRGPILAE